MGGRGQVNARRGCRQELNVFCSGRWRSEYGGAETDHGPRSQAGRFEIPRTVHLAFPESTARIEQQSGRANPAAIGWLRIAGWRVDIADRSPLAVFGRIRRRHKPSTAQHSVPGFPGMEDDWRE